MTDAETIAGLREQLARVQRQSDWFENRLDTLQIEQHRMREPERTVLCDILANGHLMVDPNGKRYGVEECRCCAAAEEQLTRMTADLDACRNLVARLNRDGGQHQDTVGMAQAARDADARVVAMLNDAAR